MESTVFETDFAGRRLRLEFGKYANQANGAVFGPVWRYGCTRNGNRIR